LSLKVRETKASLDRADFACFMNKQGLPATHYFTSNGALLSSWFRVIRDLLVTQGKEEDGENGIYTPNTSK
jgi:hypothetical protein